MTNSPDGLLFWNERLKDVSSDRLGIGLDQGRFKIVFALNGKDVIDFSESTYNDGKTHRVILTRFVLCHASSIQRFF